MTNNKRKHRYILMLTLAAAGTAAAVLYYPAVHFSFTNWDDNLLVTQNPVIRGLSFSSLIAMFTSFYVNHYHPLVMISYACEYAYAGLDPFLFHLTNIVFHVINAMLVVWLVRSLIKDDAAALIAGLFFALHPMRVESVAWIAERKDVMCSFFSLLSLLAYIRYRSSRNMKIFILALIFFLAALLSKAMAITLPLLFAAYDYYEGGRLTRKDIDEKAPFLLFSILFGIIAAAAQYSTGRIESDPSFHIVKSFFLVCYGMVSYVWKTIDPANLSPLYPYPEILGVPYPPLFWISPLIVAAAAAVVYFFARKDRILVFSSIWYAVTLLPVLQFVPVGRMMTADRFSYFPSIGLSIAAGYGYVSLSNALKNRGLFKWLLPAAACSILLLLSGAAHQMIDIWQNSSTLWSKVVHDYPSYAEGYSNLGISEADENKPDAAMEHLNKALALDSLSVQYLYNRGLLFAKLHHPDSAAGDFSKIIRLDPASLEAYVLRGDVFYECQKYRDAIKDYSFILDRYPQAAQYRLKRAHASMNNGGYLAAWNDLQLLKNYPQAADSNLLRALEYASPGGPELHAIAGQRKAVVFFQGRVIPLLRIVSADGDRYTDGKTVFRMKWAGVRLEEGRKVLFELPDQREKDKLQGK